MGTEFLKNFKCQVRDERSSLVRFAFLEGCPAVDSVTRS